MRVARRGGLFPRAVPTAGGWVVRCTPASASRLAWLRRAVGPGVRLIPAALTEAPADGPWHVHVLDVDLTQVSPRLCLARDQVVGRETVSSMVFRTRALAGVNGGFFVMHPADGTPGQPAGLTVLQGRLIHEAIPGRVALQLVPFAIGPLSPRVTATLPDSTRLPVRGVNRPPGVSRNLGPDGRPRHDFTRRLPDDVVLFTPDYGGRTPAGPGVEVVVDGHHQVQAVRSPRGGPLPAGGLVLAAAGPSATRLEALHPGQPLAVDVAGLPTGDVVNGGPWLLSGGRPVLDYGAEGFNRPADPTFLYRFCLCRHARTLAGLTAGHHLLLVTVDGKRPASSIGVSLPEAARLMRGLGAADAMALDGGGSTTMVVAGGVLGHPSDAAGERPVGDAILLFPRSKEQPEPAGSEGP